MGYRDVLEQHQPLITKEGGRERERASDEGRRRGWRRRRTVLVWLSMRVVLLLSGPPGVWCQPEEQWLSSTGGVSSPATDQEGKYEEGNMIRETCNVAINELSWTLSGYEVDFADKTASACVFLFCFVLNFFLSRQLVFKFLICKDDNTGYYHSTSTVSPLFCSSSTCNSNVTSQLFIYLF